MGICDPYHFSATYNYGNTYLTKVKHSFWFELAALRLCCDSLHCRQVIFNKEGRCTMARYSLALRLPKPLQCLHCTLMPAFECDKSAKDVADAFDRLFRAMDPIPLVSDGEGFLDLDENIAVDVVHRNRELTTAHMQTLDILINTLGAQPLKPELVGIDYRPFVRRMHRHCFAEGEEVETHLIGLFEFDPQSGYGTPVHSWELAAAFADT